MMPKWMNSIPDSEFLALGDIANKIKSKKSVFVETGCGASTLILLFYAMKNNENSIPNQEKHQWSGLCVMKLYQDILLIIIDC